MSTWTDGYVADIGYTFGYYPELNPLQLKLAFLKAGLAYPKVGTACELGFGQGVSINFHAAASITQWSGTDFNPSQAGFAQSLSTASGAEVSLFDEAFSDFANRTNLPDFDYIGLHGIWSWISDENRAVIVDFIKRKLKVGGVLYISYNTQPGWAAMTPMKDLLTEYSEVMGCKGDGIVTRIDQALIFADKLFATNPQYIQINNIASKQLELLKTQNRSYLAHEYFNKNWLPMPFSKMAEWLAPTKLQYACSTNLLDTIDELNLTTEQSTLINNLPDAMLRQTIFDFCINQKFRKDYWVKGTRKLNKSEQLEQLRKLNLLLIVPIENVSLTAKGRYCEAALSEEVYLPILEALAKHKIKTFAQLEKSLIEKGLKFKQLLEAIVVLVGKGALVLAQDSDVINKVKEKTSQLNQHLMNLSYSGEDIHYLVSPVTGGGITIDRITQIFLSVYINGKTNTNDYASEVWSILNEQGQKLLKGNQQLKTDEDNLAELNERAQTFQNKTLPIMKALQIV